MPIISVFFGIIVRLNYFDHAPPHLHAEYQGEEALFDLRTGDLIAGSLSRRKRRMVEEWMALNQDALLQDWELASTGRTTFKIAGLDNEID